MDPRAGLDVVEERKILPCWESNLGSPARNPSLYQLKQAERQNGRKFSSSHLVIETHLVPATLCVNKLRTTDNVQVTAMFVQSRRGMKTMIFLDVTS
jgi:hypothetical protein